MTRLPNPPSPGQTISVGFFRQLIAYLRENRLIAGNGMSLSRGVGGTVFNCTVEPGKGGSVAAEAKDLGLFIPTYENGVMSGIGAGYLQTADGTISVAAITFPLEGLNEDSDSESTPTYSGVVAIKAPLPNDESDSDSTSGGVVDDDESSATSSPILVGFADLGAMVAQQSTDAGEYAYIPVYELAKSEVKTDFRALPCLPGGAGGEDGVISLNALMGRLAIKGGKKIRVTPMQEKGFIKVEFDEEKEEDDTVDVPPADPCAHPGNPGGQNGAGVSEDFSSPDGNGYVSPEEEDGGVPAGVDVHAGDNNCNCD